MNEQSAYIGIMNKDGSVDSIWCKYDGYPNGLGEMLLNFYNTAKKVRDLISLGDVFSVGEMAKPPKGCTCFKDVDPCLSVTHAYYRDGGLGIDLKIRHDDNVDGYRKMSNDNHSFAYLYKNGKWYAVDCRDNMVYDKDWNHVPNNGRNLVLLTVDWANNYYKRDVDPMDA